MFGGETIEIFENEAGMIFQQELAPIGWQIFARGFYFTLSIRLFAAFLEIRYSPIGAASKVVGTIAWDEKSVVGIKRSLPKRYTLVT